MRFVTFMNVVGSVTTVLMWLSLLGYLLTNSRTFSVSMIVCSSIALLSILVDSYHKARRAY